MTSYDDEGRLQMLAPEGWLWMCIHCGKRVKDRYGNEGGWDEACMLNAVLVEEVFADALEEKLKEKTEGE